MLNYHSDTNKKWQKYLFSTELEYIDWRMMHSGRLYCGGRFSNAFHAIAYQFIIGNANNLSINCQPKSMRYSNVSFAALICYDLQLQRFLVNSMFANYFADSINNCATWRQFQIRIIDETIKQ